MNNEKSFEALLLRRLLESNSISIQAISDALDSTEYMRDIDLLYTLASFCKIVNSQDYLAVIQLCDVLLKSTGQSCETLLRWIRNKELASTHVMGQYMQWVTLSCCFIGPVATLKVIEEGLCDAVRSQLLPFSVQPPQPSHQSSEVLSLEPDPSCEATDTTS